MDVIETIAKRRSIRKFKPDPVPDHLIRQLLECARLAPSGSNSQPWRYIVVRDAALRKKLKEYAAGIVFMEAAPCVIVCCSDINCYAPKSVIANRLELRRIGVEADLGIPAADRPIPERTRQQMIVEARINSAIATEHIVLAAPALGLGTCWVHMFDHDKVHQLFNLPENLIVATLLPLGFPDQDPPQRPRKPLEALILLPIPEVAFPLEGALVGSRSH